MSNKRAETLRMLESQLRQKLMYPDSRLAGPLASAWLPAEQSEIMEALQRANEGTYGVCVDCGRNIPLARLRARPQAARCIQCQTHHERRRGVSLSTTRLAS